MTAQRYRCLGCRAIRKTMGTCDCGISSFQLLKGDTAKQGTLEDAPTVHRVTIWGDVIDTFQTEAELNGHKAEQGRLI